MSPSRRGGQSHWTYEHVAWLKGSGCDTTIFQDDDGKTYAIMPFGNDYTRKWIPALNTPMSSTLLVSGAIMARDNSDVGKDQPGLSGRAMADEADGKYVLFTAAPYNEHNPKIKTQRRRI